MKNILNKNIDDILSEKYLAYAISTIISRSLPDLRDGLKPVHRRIIYSMYQLKLFKGSSFKKSARIVGDVMGKFHPHGDQAIYDSLVRLAQEFSTRIPLIEGQGNFGNIDGDNAAAMRYTEARLENIANYFFDGLEENAVDLKENYDGQNLEPSVLPSQLPNILLNGSSGIAVGMATNIPPHNIFELNSGVSSNANDIGIIMERGSTGDNAIIAWDESEDKFIVGTTTATASDTGNLSITTGTLVGNIEGNLTGNVTGNVSGSSGSTTGNAATATTAAALTTGRTIGMTGDVVWTSASFDGSGNVTGVAALQANTVSSTELVSAVTLEIVDSGGTTVKTIIGAGS